MVKLALSVTTLAALSLPSVANAFDLGASGTPLSYAQRGLTLQQGQLRIDGGPPDFALLDSGDRNNGRSILTIAPADLGLRHETFVYVGLGGAYGVIDNLEVGTLFIPLQLSPTFEFRDIEFYGRYQFLHGDFELGAQAAISLPTNTINNQTNFAMVFGAPGIFHLSETMRLDVGAELEIILGDADVVNLDVPGVLQFQVDDAFFVGPKAGIFLPNVEEIWIGVGGVAGFSIPSDRGTPFVDIVAEFYWPAFIASGLRDAINLDIFNFVIGARVFFSVFSSNPPPPAFSPSESPPPPSDSPPPETDF